MIREEIKLRNVVLFRKRAGGIRKRLSAEAGAADRRRRRVRKLT